MTQPGRKPTYRKGRLCLLLCGRPITDDNKTGYCCGDPVAAEQVLITVLQDGKPSKQVLTLHRTKVLPDGSRRWAGTDQRGQHVIWDES